jgi:phenylacetate-CoA ligase
MDKHFLKNIRDNMPESLKYITAPLFRNKLIKNKEFCKQYNLLEAREAIPSEKINEYQLIQTKEILIHAYQNVPYYTELFNKIDFKPDKFHSFEDIRIIPFLTREIIQENFNKLISAKKIKGGCYGSTTSGSTGIPLKLLLDYDSFYKENAFIYYFRKALGYQFKDRLVTFRGIEFGTKFWKYNPTNNETIFSPFKLSRLTLEFYLDKINEIKPSYLNGYFSSIYYFAKLLSENNQTLNFRLKGVFLISENINEDERLFVESFFNARSLTFYGHTERCVIAQEIKHNKYYFDPYYGLTEKIQISENSFEIVGTGFLNRTMPLIRYKTEDLCQNESDGAISILGRRNVTDFLIGINDEKIFNSSLHFLSDILTNVTQYQFIQHKKGRAILLIVPNKNFNISEVTSIKMEIDKKLNGIIDFEIKVEEKVILSSRGKFQMFNSNISNE